MRLEPWYERIRKRAEQFQNASVEVRVPVKSSTSFNPSTNTGGGWDTKVVYKGPARIQQITRGRDREGYSNNPLVENTVLVQLRREEGWASSSTPTTFTEPKGSYKVPSGATVKVTAGGNNASLSKEVLIVDTSIDSSNMAVVDLFCNLNPEAER